MNKAAGYPHRSRRRLNRPQPVQHFEHQPDVIAHHGVGADLDTENQAGLIRRRPGPDRYLVGVQLLGDPGRQNRILVLDHRSRERLRLPDGLGRIRRRVVGQAFRCQQKFRALGQRQV